jgi:hypothetical protein
MALTHRSWAALLLVGALPMAIRLTLRHGAIPRPAVPDGDFATLPGGDVRGWRVAVRAPLWQFFRKRRTSSCTPGLLNLPTVLPPFAALVWLFRGAEQGGLRLSRLPDH